jgi:hypothetical protein
MTNGNGAIKQSKIIHYFVKIITLVPIKNCAKKHPTEDFQKGDR